MLWSGQRGAGGAVWNKYPESPMTSLHPRPLHLTLLGLLALVWYLGLAIDYLAARYDPIAALPGIPEGLGAPAQPMPVWAAVAAAIAVWLGLLGAILLLLRDRAAVLCMAFTVIAVVVAGGWALYFSDAGPRGVLGFAPDQALAAQLLVPFVLWVYARSLKQRGVFG